MSRILFFAAVLIFLFRSAAAQPPAIAGGGSASLLELLDIRDAERMDSVSLFRQVIKVDLYDEYAAVNAVYGFNNSASVSKTVLAGFEADSLKKFYIRIYVAHQPTLAARDTLLPSGKTFQYFPLTLQPGVTEVNVFYGLNTARARYQKGGKIVSGNCFRYRFTGNQIGKAGAATGDLWFRMNDGYTTAAVTGLYPDKVFRGGHSLLHSSLGGPSAEPVNEILLWYHRLNSYSVNLYRISWESKFNELKRFLPTEKTRATLSDFSAVKFSAAGETELDEEADHAVSWPKWLGIGLSFFVLALLIGSEIRRRKA